MPKSAEKLVATTVRTIYEQSSAAEVQAQHDRVVEQLAERFPEAAALLADAGPEILAFTAFPVQHWRQVWSNNPLERLNKEIRRRTNVVGIFPNRAAVVRLVGAVLAEQHDEWAEGRRYMTMRQAPARRGGGGAPRRRWPRSPQVNVLAVFHEQPRDEPLNDKISMDLGWRHDSSRPGGDRCAES